MKEILNRIITYFANRNTPLTPKITWCIGILLFLFLINDFVGFTFYYMNNQKLEHIKKIEEIKQLCQTDTLLYHYINKLEQEVLNRKNIIQKFGKLFDKVELSEEKGINTEKSPELNKDNGSPSLILRIFPKSPNRSQIWHTVTSSLIWIICLIAAIIILVISPFSKTEDRISLFIGSLFGIVFLAGIIWFTQWLFGLLPVILHRAYINYTIQIGFQIFVIWGILKISKNTNTPK